MFLKFRLCAQVTLSALCCFITLCIKIVLLHHNNNNKPLWTHSKQTAIYKLKVEKRNIEAFISTTNNTLHGYLQVKSSNFKYPDSGKMFQERLKKIINNKAKTMPES